ncbi:hypothetical protein LY78DRAFT_658593 [Colletotrichum sublineola]|nr:hypothetical protein LY78DRAFT_658593 [Colletotrichum sublineola]
MSSESPPSSPSISSSPSIQSSHSIPVSSSNTPTLPYQSSSPIPSSPSIAGSTSPPPSHSIPISSSASNEPPSPFRTSSSAPSSPSSQALDHLDVGSDVSTSSINSDVWADIENQIGYHATYRGPDYASEILDYHLRAFHSEADTHQDWDPDSASQSQSQLSDSSDSELDSSISDEIAAHEPLFDDPFSSDLADELELALLAEMDQLPHLREQQLPLARSPQAIMDDMRRGGTPNRDSSADVLVDLELYFEQGQGRPERRSQNNQNGSADVIDLTNEPDSPVQTHAARPAANPRRQNSQGRNPPSFARSDSSILAGNAPVIDLTDDSPDVPRRHAPVLPPPGPRRRQPGPFGLYNSSISGIAADIRRRLYPFRLFPGPDDDVQLLGMLHNRINPGADFNNPLGNIQLQYEHSAFNRAESPKPIHQPPPPAKSGFTRDTGSDVVVICPACNEELAYDPDVPVSGSHPTRKGKRQRSEHHFWALKGCGHVYCEDCFENRKPAAKRPHTGFRRDPESKIICAVDGCETQATNKTGWVGIYL